MPIEKYWEEWEEWDKQKYSHNSHIASPCFQEFAGESK